jgi:hypothetical protein
LLKSQTGEVDQALFESRGLEVPNGNIPKRKLVRQYLKPPMYQKLSEEVKQLCDDGLLLDEIGKRLVTQTERFLGRDL